MGNKLFLLNCRLLLIHTLNVWHFTINSGLLVGLEWLWCYHIYKCINTRLLEHSVLNTNYIGSSHQLLLSLIWHICLWNWWNFKVLLVQYVPLEESPDKSNGTPVTKVTEIIQITRREGKKTGWREIWQGSYQMECDNQNGQNSVNDIKS